MGVILPFTQRVLRVATTAVAHNTPFNNNKAKQKSIELPQELYELSIYNSFIEVDI